MNSMLFFLGGSFGTAVLMALVTSNGPDGASLNPLHTGAAYRCRQRLQRRIFAADDTGASGLGIVLGVTFDS